MRPAGQNALTLFLFFNNRMGCMGSLLFSIGASVVLMLLLGIIDT